MPINPPPDPAVQPAPSMESHSPARELSKTSPTRPTRRVKVTQKQLDRLFEAAAATGNKEIFHALTTELPRSCVVIRESDLPMELVDQDLAERVAKLEDEANEWGEHVAELRERGEAILNKRVSKHLNDVCAPHLAKPQLPLAESVSPPFVGGHVDKSIARLGTVATGVEKMRKKVEDTKKRASNLRTVLERIGEDAAGNVDANVSQTIQADWTILMEDAGRLRSKKNMSSKFSSPIPTHAKRREDASDEGMISPFVTPRSKLRRRTARQCCGLPPMRLHMPR